MHSENAEMFQLIDNVTSMLPHSPLAVQPFSDSSLPPMLCPLSGLNALGGPGSLIDHEDLETVSTIMASEILTYGQVSLDLQNLASILSSALEFTLLPLRVYGPAPKLPGGVSDWEYFTPIGIGHFEEDGYSPVDEHGRCPSGRYVQIRRLVHYESHGRFYGVIVVDEGGARLKRKKSFCRSFETVINNCNLFVMHGCLEYLRAWLDPSLPSRVAFMDSTPSLSLEGELYEIINSRHEIIGKNI